MGNRSRAVRSLEDQHETLLKRSGTPVESSVHRQSRAVLSPVFGPFRMPAMQSRMTRPAWGHAGSEGNGRLNAEGGVLSEGGSVSAADGRDELLEELVHLLRCAPDVASGVEHVFQIDFRKGRVASETVDQVVV